MALPALLATWQHACPVDASSLVAPDGCRDLIAVERAGMPARWFVSPLADTSYAVGSRAGTQFTGYRLHPGAQVDEHELLTLLRTVDPADTPKTLTLIERFTGLNAGIEEALSALAQAASVGGAARSLGVAERSLERLVRRHTDRAPVFWRQLARVRCAAHALGESNVPLAALAADHGFSDQAHMNREFRRWLGTTPTQVRAQATWRHLMAQSGYGDPLTGVQISTKNPSRSAT